MSILGKLVIAAVVIIGLIAMALEGALTDEDQDP